ncbi:hypothetical protein Cflav_PD1692 [Pedosphaera parvula Ellin514]|uniref:Uncharacterized protein n=1 Tax=Pedosphaera parvula (strain Ellin514) TaxID=320771 RepID=B9XMT4_PEDPL|nr:hypothetical protein Cflav_PD1692 [Pedosphaera parvula Ellin514]
MNDWSQLEKELQSWIPRPPSDKIKQQLFPEAMLLQSRPLTFPFWSWFAPALCMLILACTIWLSHNDVAGHLPLTSSNSNMLVSLSDHKLLPGLAADRQCQEWNVLSATFILASLTMPDRNLLTFISSTPTWREGNSLSTTFDWTKTPSSLSTTGSFPSWKTNIEKL